MRMTVNGSSVFIYNELGELILAHLSLRGYEAICRTTLMELAQQRTQFVLKSNLAMMLLLSGDVLLPL